MGCARQAVLDFDEEVQAPWRPLLVHGGAAAEPAARPSVPRPTTPRRSSRVGACTPRVGRAARVGPVAGREPARAVATHPGRPSDGARRPAPRRRVHGTAPSGSPAPVRLTRRARRLLVLLVVCTAVGLGSWLGSLVPGERDGDLRLAGVTSVVVEPGDSLWSIAAAVADGEDVRAVIDRIQELNGLQGSVLVPGQVLELP